MYDRGILIVVLSFLICFVSLNVVVHPTITIETLLIRALGWSAILLLHIILLIGPLARLDRRFLIILYNRRHMGVSMFILALAHGLFSIIQNHSLGNMNPIRSVFISNLHYDSISQFPFQTLGFIALLILALMAASSHDFWLKNIGKGTWKALHMMVYVAYGLLILHVILGALQNESSPVIFAMISIGFLSVSGLHLLTGFRETRMDRPSPAEGDWIFVCFVDEIEENRAKMANVGEERVAIFKYDGKLSAVDNVCQHQGGPLGEGKVVDGCITCPWHGYQYLPHNGQSPPPFTEKLKTYEVALRQNKVYVNRISKAPGTAVEPITIL